MGTLYLTNPVDGNEDDFEIAGDEPTTEELKGIQSYYDSLKRPDDAPKTRPTSNIIGENEYGKVLTMEALNKMTWLSGEEKKKMADQIESRYDDGTGKYKDGWFSDSYDGNRIPMRTYDPVDGTLSNTNQFIPEGINNGIQNSAEFVADVGDLVTGGINKAGKYLSDPNTVAGAKATADALSSSGSVTGFISSLPARALSIAGEPVGNLLEKVPATNMGERVEEKTTRYVEDGVGFVNGARSMGQEAAGYLAPGKILQLGVKGLMRVFGKKAKQSTKIAAESAGAVVGGISGIDTESSGLFLGDEAMFKGLQETIPVLKGLNYDEDASRLENNMKARLNFLIEDVTFGKAIAGSVKLAGVVGKVSMEMFLGGAATAVGAGRRTRQQELAVREITDRLIAAQGATGGEEKEAFVRNLVEALDKHAETIIEIDQDIIGTITVDNSTMNAFLQAVAEGDMEVARKVVQKAKGIQQAQVLKGADTAQAASNMAQATDEALIGGIDNLGGADAANSAVKRVQDDALEELDGANTKVADIDAELEETRVLLEETIKDDPLLSETLDALSSKSGVDFRAENSSGLMTDIVDRIGAAYGKLKGQRNEVYGEVQGGDLDFQGMYDFLRGVEPAQLDAARMSLGRTNQLKGIFDVIDQSRTVVDEVMDAKGKTSSVTRAKTDEELMEDFVQALEDAGITDYGSMFQNLRGPLAALKSELFQGADVASKGAGQELDQFIKYIDGDLLDAADDVDLKELVEGAKAWDNENFIPFFRATPPLREIARIYDQQIYSSSNPSGVRSNAQPMEMRTVGGKLVSEAFTEANRFYGQKIVKLLQSAEGGESADDVVGWIVNEVMAPLQSSVKLNGQASEEAIMQAVNSLQNYGTVLRDFPEVAQRIRNLEDGITSSRGKQRLLDTELEKAKVSAAEIEKRVYKGELEDFFGDQGLPIKEGQQIIDKLISDFNTKDIGRLESLSEAFQASGNPVLIEGLQAAYLARVKRAFVTTSRSSADSPVFSLAQIAKDTETGDGTGRMLEGLRMVFADKPAVADGVIDLLARSGNEQAIKSNIAIPTQSGTAGLQEQTRAFNSMVTVLLGPLSRTGSRVRAIGTRFINKVTDESQYNDVIDELLANPKVYSEVLQKIANQDYGTLTGYKGFVNRNLDITLNSFVAAGIFDADRAEEYRLMDEDTIAEMIEMEEAFRENKRTATGFFDKVGDQMKSLFD